MSKSIKRKARHKSVFVYLLYHGNHFYGVSKRAFLGVHDAREDAREKINHLAHKLGITTSYFTFETLDLSLVSATKTKKTSSKGPY
jgi:hypothetical protein